MTGVETAPRTGTDADLVAAHGLLGTLVREVALADAAGEHLVVRLPGTGTTLRVRLRRRSAAGAHRFAGPVEELAGEWIAIGADRLADLAHDALAAATGHTNPEFAAQVRAGRDAVAMILRERPARPRRVVPGAVGAYLDSEQGLLVGHPRHPAPKWRSGSAEDWRRYAPELRTAFPLRWFAAASEIVVEHGAFDEHARVPALLAGRQLPAGYRALPVHPWQARIVAGHPVDGPALRRALADGTLLDLGEAGLPLHPTSSVRTLYQPDADVFLKTSLTVRITNCIRRNSEPELAGAVHLTRLLAGPLESVAVAHPGFAVLAEPASRTVRVDAPDGPALAGSLGTIVRSGLSGHAGPGERVHVAATLAAEHPGLGVGLADLGGGEPWACEWWRRYVRLLVPPVLALWARHGVVLEPHLQNVLVVVGPDGLPVRVRVRDLEGTKLVTGIPALRELPAPVAAAVEFDPERAWCRVAYCLLVNNLVEVAAALCDVADDVAGELERRIWADLAEVLAETDLMLGGVVALRDVLAGRPLPAKANLGVRWRRVADREACYVPFPNPIGAL